MLNDLVDNWDADINFANPGDHVPDIERENRTVQERFRVKIHCLPFEVIPRTMIWYLVLRITKNRSLFPKKTGISKHFSLYLIMKRRVIDFNKEFAVSFGDYVQVYHEEKVKNNNIPRSNDAIYLRAKNSLQEGHEVMDLLTGRMITCNRVEYCKMTRLVIQRVKELAKEQGFQTLKFFNT